MPIRTTQRLFASTFCLIAFCLSIPVQAGIFGTSMQCGVVLKGLESLDDAQVKNQEIISSSKGPEDKVVSLFQRLPKKLRKEVAFNLGVYFAKYSPRADALSLATHLYFGERMGPKSFSLAKEMLKKGDYYSDVNSDYLEYSLRMNPRLNDLMRFFQIPGAESGYASAQGQQRAIETQLGHLEPLQAQMVVRAVIDDLIKNENKTVNPYAYQILMQVAKNLVGDKDSRVLAAGLPLVYAHKGLLPKPDLANQQLRRAARNLLSAGFGELGMARVKSAIRKSLGTEIFSEYEPSLAFAGKLLSMLGAVIYNMVDISSREEFEKARYTRYYGEYWDSTSHDNRVSLHDFTGYSYLEHWKVQAATLGLIVSAYTLKGLYHFIYDLREPNPGGYLRAETDFELQQLKDDLQQQINSVLTILGAQIAQGPTNPTAVAPVTVPPNGIAPVTVPPSGPAHLPVPPQPALTTPSTLADAELEESDLVSPSNADHFDISRPILENRSSTHEDAELALSQVTDSVVASAPIRALKAKEVRLLFNEKKTSHWLPLTKEQEEANQSFFGFFNEVKLHLLERDTLIDHFQLGYLLKEPVNIQMLGEAGVAKTHVATQIMGRINGSNGQPSFFRTQMGVNTTIGELIGIVKQSGLKEDRIIRAAERGLPGYENNFLDEYYNAPADTRHDLLTLQAEGVLTMGGETYRSKSRMNLYASNKYPDQVFFDAGNDSPRAEMDRMLFTHIVSPTFEYDENMLDLEQLRQTPPKAHLTFAEIDQLRGLADRIEIPRYYLAKTKLIINRLRQNEIKREHESKIDWIQRERNGEVNLTPPTYMARVLSPRSEKRAYQLLKTFALADWLAAKANGQEISAQPEISEIHFAKLVEFFVYNGPSDEHIERILREYPKGSIPHQQFSTLKRRRQEFINLLFVTTREVNMEQPMKELDHFRDSLHVGFSGLEIDGLKLDAEHRLNDKNATIVAALIEWHKGLTEQLATKGKIVEVNTSDVALLRAHYLGGNLIHKLLER